VLEPGDTVTLASGGEEVGLVFLTGLVDLDLAGQTYADLCGRTSVPGIFAAGDCAEAIDPLTGRSAVSGIWPVAYEMGRAAGAAAVGIERPSAGALRMNASRFFGEPIISIGEVCPERLDGATAEVLTTGGGIYRKLVYQEGRLAGALLYGDISDAGTFYRQYREGN